MAFLRGKTLSAGYLFSNYFILWQISFLIPYLPWPWGKVSSITYLYSSVRSQFPWVQVKRVPGVVGFQWFAWIILGTLNSKCQGPTPFPPGTQRWHSILAGAGVSTFPGTRQLLQWSPGAWPSPLSAFLCRKWVTRRCRRSTMTLTCFYFTFTWWFNNLNFSVFFNMPRLFNKAIRQSPYLYN